MQMIDKFILMDAQNFVKHKKKFIAKFCLSTHIYIAYKFIFFVYLFVHILMFF